MLGFMVWELVAEATNSTGYYIENGISKRSCEGVDVTCRHLIGYVLGAQHGCRHGVDMPSYPLKMVEEVATEYQYSTAGTRHCLEVVVVVCVVVVLVVSPRDRCHPQTPLLLVV